MDNYDLPIMKHLRVEIPNKFYTKFLIALYMAGPGRINGGWYRVATYSTYLTYLNYKSDFISSYNLEAN